MVRVRTDRSEASEQRQIALRFEGFELRLGRELLRGGRPVTIGKTALDLLGVLVMARRDLVTKDKLFAANGKDFDARFGLAALQAFEGDFAAAFDQLLEVVLRDKAEGKPDRERARKQLIDWFVACPDAEVVSRGRRYLGKYLN